MDTYQNINALVGENRIGEAISVLDGILKTDPEDSRALFERGNSSGGSANDIRRWAIIRLLHVSEIPLLRWR